MNLADTNVSVHILEIATESSTVTVACKKQVSFGDILGMA